MIAHDSVTAILNRTSAADRFPRYTLLGVEVDAMVPMDLIGTIETVAKSNQRAIVANHNLHSIYLVHRDEKMRQFYDRAAYTFIDGMSLVYAGQLLGLPLQRRHRMTAVDWLRPVLIAVAQRGWRVFFLGSAPGVAERAAGILRQEIQGLRIEVANGYFDMETESEENAAVLGRIRAFRPHLLIVGMGMPRQEHWIVQHLEFIQANVIMNQGAFMDYVAGETPTPPRWISHLGFEWLARLLANPHRLWQRYLIEPWALLPLFGRDFIRKLRGTLEQPR